MSGPCWRPVPRRVESEAAVRALEVAVALTDYWLGRHPAEGLDWLRRLQAAAPPLSALRAQAALSGAHLAYWLTDFAVGREMGEEARARFAAIGDPLGEGRALRRLGAIAAATDDVDAAREYLEASLARLDEAGVEREIGTTLLHLGSLLADQGLSDAARPLLARALAIAVTSGDPLARGHALAALNLADWKGGDLDAAMREGEEALAIFARARPSADRGDGQLPAGRGGPRPRSAQAPGASPRQAIAAGEASRAPARRWPSGTSTSRGSTSTTGDTAAAAAHLHEALLALDPVADRWVLADGARGRRRGWPAGGRRRGRAPARRGGGHPRARSTSRSPRPRRPMSTRRGPSGRPRSRAQRMRPPSARGGSAPRPPSPMRSASPAAWPARRPAPTPLRRARA